MRYYRRFVEDTLVIATHNKGKFAEIKVLFDKFDFTVLSADKLALSEPEETETSFQGNALLKARHSAKLSSLPALADDSGLTVTSLNGAPGIYSARWAAPDGNFDSAMQRVHDELLKISSHNFSAQFVCALALKELTLETKLTTQAIRLKSLAELLINVLRLVKHYILKL